MAATTTDLRRPLFPTFVWGLILFCFFGLLAVVAVRYYGTFQTYEDQRGQVRLANLEKYREEMASKLGTLAWADKEAQTVQVPIDVAMGIAAKNLNKKQVSPSAVTIAPPAPAEPAAPDAAEISQPTTQE
jgi:hypothetical protein